ncbi:MAG: hypothetical protein RR954_06790 [Christensenellaceae bacterium]
MNIEEIRKNAPSGATHYYQDGNITAFYFKSNYGFRQIHSNIIDFYESSADLIKPLY